MSISSAVTRKAGPFTSTGAIVPLPFTFKVFLTSDVLVVQTDLSGVETTLALTANYTVSLNADQDANPGGSVSLVSAAPAGYLITIGSQVAETQPTVLTNTGGFFPTVINDALDRVTILVQQLFEKLTRTLTLPFSVPSGTSTTLPFPKANNVIGWNSAATGLQNLDATALATVAAYGTANSNPFSGDGVTVNFTLSANPGALNNLEVAIGGVLQRPTIDYTWVSGTTLTFTTAPPAGANNILVRYLSALPQGTMAATAVTASDGGNGSLWSDVQGAFNYIKSSLGSGAVGFIQSGAGAIKVWIQDELRLTLRPEQYGAAGTGLVDDTSAIQNMIAELNTRGGGVCIFDGIYDLGVNPAGAMVTKFNITASKVTLIFRKGTKFTYTSDTTLLAIFNIAGGSDITTIGELHVEGAVTTNYTTTGTAGARALTIDNSASGNSGNIKIDKIRLIRGAVGLLVGASNTTANRIKGITFNEVYTEDATYGVNFAHNGDIVRGGNVTTVNAFRSYFAYGCEDHQCDVISRSHHAGGTCINLSRFSSANGGGSTNTANYRLNLKVVSPQDATSEFVALRHLGDDGATQKIQNIFVHVTADALSNNTLQLRNYTASGGVETATTFNAVIDNIHIRSDIPYNTNALYYGISNWAAKPNIYWTGATSILPASVVAAQAVLNLSVLATDHAFLSGEVVIPNAKAYRSRLAAGAVLDLAAIDASDVITLGSSSDAYTYLKAGSNGYIIYVGANARWQIQNTRILPFQDNTSDIGSAAQRVANVVAKTYYSGAGSVLHTSGTGSPEGVVTAPVGSTYTRSDGGIGTTLYRKEGGSGNTGWNPVAYTKTGSFTCAANATTTVAETMVLSASSKIMLMPTNAAAATLMGAATALYVSAKTANTSFAVTTANGVAAAGTETFDYIIVN